MLDLVVIKRVERFPSDQFPSNYFTPIVRGHTPRRKVRVLSWFCHQSLAYESRKRLSLKVKIWICFFQPLGGGDNIRHFEARFSPSKKSIKEMWGVCRDLFDILCLILKLKAVQGIMSIITRPQASHTCISDRRNSHGATVHCLIEIAGSTRH